MVACRCLTWKRSATAAEPSSSVSPTLVPPLMPPPRAPRRARREPPPPTPSAAFLPDAAHPLGRLPPLAQFNRLGRVGLHAVGQLVAGNARGQVRVVRARGHVLGVVLVERVEQPAL